jgi:hypothetical protein
VVSSKSAYFAGKIGTTYDLHQLKLQFPGVELVDLLLGVGFARDKGGHWSERSLHPGTQLSAEREEEIKDWNDSNSRRFLSASNGGDDAN